MKVYPPGSEWLYVKLYGGPAALDELLSSLHEHLISRAMQYGWADQWFFIRYGDPDYHLRLRFHGKPEVLAGTLLPELHKLARSWLDDGRLTKWQLDTYEPELLRYGGPNGLPLAEQLFHADSEAVAKLVRLYPGSNGLDARWRLSLVGVDQLLTELGLSAAEKQTLIEQYRDGYAAEFQTDRNFRKAVSGRFRQERELLDALMLGELERNHPLLPGLAVIHERSRQQRSAIASLIAADRDSASGVSIANMAPSLIHMHVNRAIRSAQRAHELVLYDMLALLYRSKRSTARSPIVTGGGIPREECH